MVNEAGVVGMNINNFEGGPTQSNQWPITNSLSSEVSMRCELKAEQIKHRWLRGWRSGELHLCRKGMQLVSSGYNPVLMQKGMKAPEQCNDL